MLKLVRRPDSAHWHIRGTLRGVRVRESTYTDSRPHAEAVLARRQQEILDRATFGEARTATWAEAVNLYLDLGGDARYLKPLVERWGTWRLAAITALEIARAGRDLYPGCKASTLDRQLYTPVIAVLNDAAHAGLCAPPKIRRPKVETRRVEASDDATIDAILSATGKIDWKPGSRGAQRQADARVRLRAFVLMMTLTGCRVAEAVAVLRRDVNLDATPPDVLFSDTKNGDARRAVMPPELTAAIRALPVTDTDEPLLGYASRYTAARALRRAAQAAGVAPVGPHRIGRHTFAARLLNNGATLKDTKEAGGWKTLSVVDRNYGHLERSRVDAAVLSAADTRLTRTPVAPSAKVIDFKGKK
jgi:integrase